MTRLGESRIVEKAAWLAWLCLIMLFGQQVQARGYKGVRTFYNWNNKNWPPRSEELKAAIIADCSGQPIPDTTLSFSSTTPGASPWLN